MLSRMILLIVGLLASRATQVVEDRPRLLACGPMAFSVQTLCVCGDFPDPAADELVLAGEPLGRPLSATRNRLTFRVPEDTKPGLHIISGSPRSRFAVSDAVVVTTLGLVAEIDQNALLTGQQTRARFR